MAFGCSDETKPDVHSADTLGALASTSESVRRGDSLSRARIRDEHLSPKVP